MDARIKPYANLQGASLQGANLQGANLRNANLQSADLRTADLRNANLQSADLRGAGIDFAAWPLCCGSVGAKVDRRIAVQLLAHACLVNCDDPEVAEELKRLKESSLVRSFHHPECLR